MSIRVLFVLGMVIGTLGLAVERNDTIGDVSPIVSHTTENHDGNVTTTRTIQNVEGIGQHANIERDLKNNSVGIGDNSSVINDTFHNPIDVENSTLIVNVNNLKVNDELKPNSNEIVKRVSVENGSSTNSNNIELSTLMNDFNHSKSHQKPKNIILILSEETDDDTSWETLKKNYSFAVKGVFQSCEKEKKSDETEKVTLTDDINCDCHEKLNRVIKDLMVYARNIRGMYAGIISEGNLNTPTALGSDNLAHHHHHHHKSKLIGDIDNVAINHPIHRYHSQSSNDSLALYIDNQLASSVQTRMESSTPTTIHSSIKHHPLITQERIWEFFNMVVEFRWDFIRNILESMNKNLHFGKAREMIARRNLLHIRTQQPTFIELITKTLMDPKLISNENGFLMIIFTPHRELLGVYKLIENKISPKDDLIIISGIHATDDKRLIPYLANGLGSNNFINLQNICKLSSAIKLVLSHCQGDCEDEDFTPPSISIPSESLISKKRVARSDEEETPMEEDKPAEKDGTEGESGQDDADDGGDDDNDERPKSAGISFYCKNDPLALTISIVLSICTAFILHS